MNPDILAQVVNVISSHGYLFVFFAMIVEGPVVTTAAAFAAASHIFHPFPILLLSVVADTVGDILYYGLGRLGRIHLVEKYGKRFGLETQKVGKIGHLLKENTWATLSAIKIAPGFSTLGLIIAGASNIPFKKYMHICLYITIPRSLLFVVLGYYAGRANAIADRYLHHSQFAFILIVVGILVINWLYQKISNVISEKIEKI